MSERGWTERHQGERACGWGLGMMGGHNEGVRNEKPVNKDRMVDKQSLIAIVSRRLIQKDRRIGNPQYFGNITNQTELCHGHDPEFLCPPETSSPEPSHPASCSCPPAPERVLPPGGRPRARLPDCFCHGLGPSFGFWKSIQRVWMEFGVCGRSLNTRDALVFI